MIEDGLSFVSFLWYDSDCQRNQLPCPLLAVAVGPFCGRSSLSSRSPTQVSMGRLRLRGCRKHCKRNSCFLSEPQNHVWKKFVMLDLELERTDPINWKLSETVGLFALKNLKSILLKLNDAGHRAEKIKQSFCIIIYIFTYLYKVSIQIIFYCWEKWFLIIRLPSLHFFN